MSVACTAPGALLHLTDAWLEAVPLVMQQQVIYRNRHSLHLPINPSICQVFLGIMSLQLVNPIQWSHVPTFMSSAQALANKRHQVAFIVLKSPCILNKYSTCLNDRWSRCNSLTIWRVLYQSENGFHFFSNFFFMSAKRFSVHFTQVNEAA